MQRSYIKAIKNNPNLTKIRSKNSCAAKMKVNPDTGLNGFQAAGLKITGSLNPSCNPDNAKKISEGRKRYISEKNSEWIKHQKFINDKLSDKKDKNGLTARDKHSIWMFENNPASNTVWYNNGSKNLRINLNDDIPMGFIKGRLKFKHKIKDKPALVYYNDGIRNVKIRSPSEIPDGFLKGYLKKIKEKES